MPEYLQRFLQGSLDLTGAETGVLVLLQDLLLGDKRLAWIDLPGTEETRRGGYVFGMARKTEEGPAPDGSRQIARKMLARAVSTGRCLHVHDLMKDPEFKTIRPDEWKEGEARSVLCVPIRKAEEMGLIYLDHSQPGFFGDETVENLKLFTEIASVGLQNMLNEGLAFILSGATSRFLSADVRVERRRLIEIVLNEFKLRLGFSRVVFVRVSTEAGAAEIESAILDVTTDEGRIVEQRIPLDPEDDLLRTLLKDKKIVSVEPMERKDEVTLTARIQGRTATVTNPGVNRLLRSLNDNPVLCIPLYLPNGVSGILFCDKHGLPIVLGNTVLHFLISLSNALSLVLNWADEYQDMNKRLTRLYEERIRRESLTELGSIIGEVSHVISPPISHLISNLDLLSRADLPPATIANLKKMNEWSLKIRKYLFYVQDLARTEELTPILRLHDVQECIANAWAERVAPFYPAVRLERENAEPRIPPFLFDSLQVASALANLFMNAARAMGEEGGVIRVGTELRDGRVRISVADTGGGIPAELLSDFFNMDRRIQHMWPQKGRGKGTLIYKEIIKRHQGAIEILSKGGFFLVNYGQNPGERHVFFDEHQRRDGGTTVVVSLPYSTGQFGEG